MSMEMATSTNTVRRLTAMITGAMDTSMDADMTAKRAATTITETNQKVYMTGSGMW
jgi:hypothetical protein